jgi:hypothetical protein
MSRSHRSAFRAAGEPDLAIACAAEDRQSASGRRPPTVGLAMAAAGGSSNLSYSPALPSAPQSSAPLADAYRSDGYNGIEDTFDFPEPLPGAIAAHWAAHGSSSGTPAPPQAPPTPASEVITAYRTAAPVKPAVPAAPLTPVRTSSTPSGAAAESLITHEQCINVVDAERFFGVRLPLARRVRLPHSHLADPTAGAVAGRDEPVRQASAVLGRLRASRRCLCGPTRGSGLAVAGACTPRWLLSRRRAPDDDHRRRHRCLSCATRAETQGEPDETGVRRRCGGHDSGVL